MELKNIQVKEISETKTNPRGNDFEDKNFDEFTKSIEEKGVLMPILGLESKGWQIKKSKQRIWPGTKRSFITKRLYSSWNKGRLLRVSDKSDYSAGI